MEQIIFNTLELLTDIPVNIWPWLLLVSAPLLIFSAKPDHSVWKRVGRIFLAVAIGYVLINLTLHTHRALGWRAYEECQQQILEQDRYPDPCRHFVNIADGASTIFYLILGWVPAAAYVGFWEFWWRRKYKLQIKALGKTYKGSWFSTLLIVCSVPVWLFIILLIIIIISKIIYIDFNFPSSP